MKRLHLFEFTDLKFWPDPLRSMLTELLDWVGKLLKPFRPYCDLIAEAVNSVGSDQIVDFCSGAGGPWTYLLPRVEQICGRTISVLLTDKFPSRTFRSRVNATERIVYSATPIDVLCPPPNQKGLWSLFNSFHHFPPSQACRLLQNAVDGGHPIVIFEMLRRTPLDLIGMMRIPLIVLLLMPFVRPFNVWRLVFTYVIPIGPFVLSWDGFVSVLRCYTPEELIALADSLNGDSYIWKAGADRTWLVSITYLVGYPERSRVRMQD
jgi:hypothetical protein